MIFGNHDKKTLAQYADVASRAKYAALMADGHMGYVMPIGGVAAYDGLVSPVGVGFDIACGNAAILTDKHIDDYSPERLTELANEIQSTISFGVGRKNNADDAPVDDPLFEDAAWQAIPAQHRGNLREKARSQLGTVGSGNHYVDVFHDERGRVWVGVHFGSRGFGHGIASGFMALAQNEKWDARVPEREDLLSLASPLGDAYWTAMNLAGKYAYAGREWVARKVVDMLGANELDLVHNHHNFAWLEKHFGQQLVVVRKGATPAFPNERGFVGGSMGDNAVILRGRAPKMSEHVPEGGYITKQKLALFSTVHGAGRVLGRKEAKKGRVITDAITGLPTGQRDRSVIISRRMQENWLTEKGVILRGGDVDEAPQAYRRLPDVLAAQGDTIEISHTLTPKVVVMAGHGEYDPYKD